MLNPNVYTQAAELLVNNNIRGACTAIGQVPECMELFTPYISEFAGVFNEGNHKSYWYGFEMTEENQMARSLALLFMAEIAKEKE
jgi:hypothetical protein